MKSKIKRHSRSAMSILLTICMLISCMTVGLIATDAAKVQSDDVGYDTYYVKGSWDSWSLHNITSSSWSVSLNANTTYSFVFMANNDQFSSNVTIKNTTNYNFSRNNNDAITLQTAAAGSYKFSFSGMDGGQTSMSVRIEFPVDTTPTTWTAVGDSTALFGTTWAPTATANDLTKGSGTTWSKTWSGVSLTNGSTIKYKVAKNHAWTTTCPKSNATATVPGTSGTGTGLYNVTVTYNESGNAVNMTITPATTYTLKVPTVAHAVVKATYNGSTANEGGTLSGIPAGASVTISVTPDAGWSLNSISSNPSATISGSGNTRTLTMPGANVTSLTVNLNDETSSLKRVYFYNVNTEYAMVSAYVDYNGRKPLGVYPGSTMTRLNNSNVWYVDVPGGATDITFIGDNGNNTGSLNIPNSTNPMYTAGPSKTSPATGGTWGTYTARNNEYTVSKGSTLNDTSLFTGITATMYDYYTDGEITNGWLNGIGNREYSKNNGHDFDWNPFRKLDDALHYYAKAKGVTYPLYFGNLNTTIGSDEGENLIKVQSGADQGNKYYNWVYAPNNSNGLGNGHTHDSVTGLTGKTIQNNNTRHYKEGATNENGAPMAFFDEDFLSGINSQNTTLATILRSAAFPVRQTTEGATVSGITKLHLDPTGGSWTDGNAVFDAYFWGSSLSGTWKQFTGSGTDYVADIPSGAQNVIITRNGSHVTSFTAWNQSEDISLTLSGSSAKNKVKFTGWNNGEGTFSSSLDTSLSGCTTTGGHDYYEFDSTDGKDNAYVREINKTSKTAQLDYYANSNKVYAAGMGSNGGAGFYPFDYNSYQNNVGNNPHDLGFGMKLEIPFTLDANGINSSDSTHQVFRFSGDDDLWVYVDGQLVLDLGGAHLKSEGTIDFATESVTANLTQSVGSGARNGSFASWFDNSNPNAVHTMTIYYMERGMYDSNLKFGFSFHAIPNQLKVEKKVRTANVNQGFYILNSNTTSDYTVDNGRSVTWFEKSYQYEDFDITQTSASAPKTHPSVKYTMERAPGSTQAGSTQLTATTSSSNNYQIGYALRNDFTAYFMDQYNSGTSITVKENPENHDYYRFTPSVAVYDDANNGTVVTGTGNATSGYTFDFAETHATGLENLNLRARFTNQMITHDLYVYKNTNVTDTKTDFTLNIKFKTDPSGITAKGYIAYPLYCTVNGEDRQLTTDGNITIKAGQELIIPKVPENAQVQITESLPNDSAYAYSGVDVSYTSGAAASSSPITGGTKFTMGSGDMKATVNNRQSDPVVISHDLKPGSVGEADTYVTAVVTNSAGTTTKESYAKTPGFITVDPSYIKKGSTDKLVITLDTTPIGAYAFDHFWEDIRSTMSPLVENGVKYTATIDENAMTATVTIVIGDLFDSSTGTQLYTELPFYSSLLDLQRELTITKKLTTGTDANTEFTFNVTKNGSAYTGAYKLNGTAATTDTGIFTVHQNDVIKIEGLHVGENIAVFESNIPFNYEFSKATLGTDDNTNVASGTSTGYAYNVSDDTAITIWNAPIKYYYEVWYHYSSYRYLHQEQQYKVTGNFDANTPKVADYLEVSDQVEDADSTTSPKQKVTAYWFKGDTERSNFINILGPYEDNFMKAISWNTAMRSESNPGGTTIRYNSSTHTYTIDVYALVAEHSGVDLNFKLPYQHNPQAGNYSAVVNGEGKVLYDPTQTNVEIPNLNYGTWFSTNGAKWGDEEEPEFVTAPLVIYDGDQPMGFKYWTVKTTASDSSYAPVEYTKCYYHEFNLAIYQDSIAEPHYENITAEEAANYHHDAHQEAMKDGNANGAVITFLENSRNQYNVINNNITQPSRRNRGDRIYTDFVLSYASEGDLKYQDYANGQYTAGLAIQKVALLDDDGSGGKNTDNAYYANKYGADLNSMTYNGAAFSQSTLETFIEGTPNFDDSKGLERSQFDANKLDNKNRIQYYYSYSVRSHTDLTDNGNKNYVYRAFAFMKDTNGNVTMVSQPLYFTFYDMASIESAYAANNNSNP